MDTTAETTVESTGARKPYVFVIQSGIITTVLALAGVYWIGAHSDTNPMGFYVDYFLPVGAILVGFVAGAGYGLASWFTGARISRWLMVTVVALQACGYLAAEYIEYREVRENMIAQGLVLRSTGEPPSFFQYYDFKARSFAWKPEHSGDKQGEPLGAWGYFFVLFGAVGFIASGLIAPAILLAVPYCGACQRYMSKKILGVIPASLVQTSKPVSPNLAENPPVQTGEELLQRLRDVAAAENPDGFKQELASAGNSKANNKLPRRIEIALVWCKACSVGYLLPTIVTGKGKQMRRTPQPKTDVSADFVRAILP